MLNGKQACKITLLWALLLPLVSNAYAPDVFRSFSSNKTLISDVSFHRVLFDTCKYFPSAVQDFPSSKAIESELPNELSFSASPMRISKQNGIQNKIVSLLNGVLTKQLPKLSSSHSKVAQSDERQNKSSTNYVLNSVLSQGNWYKLGVTQTGIHQMRFNDLVAMGINPASLNPSKIGIFSRGGAMLPEANSASRTDDLPEIAIEVTGEADGSFDQGDQILFYAQGPVQWQFNTLNDFWEHTSHLYADTICYFFTPDRGSGKRIQVIESSAATESELVDSYDYFTFYEENNFNLLKSGRQWFSQIFDVILNRSFPFEVPPLASGGEINVRIVTAAKSLLTSSFDFTIGNQTWFAPQSAVSSFKDSPVATGSTVYKSLHSISLPLKIDVHYNKTLASAAGYLDLIDINARCDLKFAGGQLDFRDSRSAQKGHTSQYLVRDAARKVRLWEVTNPINVASIKATADGNDLTFKLSSDTIRQFVAFDENKLLKPHFIKKIPNQNLHASAGSDMIIIAPQAFLPQAIRLATFHANTSDLNVLVLDPITIYNEFSSGTTDISAIRDFMKMLYNRSSTAIMPDYLLLFGDASYDFKGKLAANDNFIPSWQSPESYSPISSLVSDDYYGMLDSNEGNSYSDVIDLGIGRLPVKTLQEAEQAVDKIIHYSVPAIETSGDWQNFITFVADDEDYNEHISQAEQMAENIEANYPEINLDKIYLDAYVQVATPVGNRYPDVNSAITERIKKGSLILNYTGHGGETGWAHEEVLTVNTITNWTNFDNLPVFVTATCEFSRFDDPLRQSAGEFVLTNPKGGGIALFTTTRPTYGTPNFELNKKFYQYALSKSDGKPLRMGDIIMKSKRDKGSNENGRKYVLLGDPALQIKFPSLKVITQSVNGRIPGNGSDTLKAYMEVNITGIIADDKGKLVSDFNGTVFPSVFDKLVTLKTLANDGGSGYSFRIRKNLLYKGKVIVTDGKFSFTFTVPKDIAYRYDSGKISYFAIDGVRDASGSYTDIIIGGSSEPEASDNQGPEISLYINSLQFRNGGLTNPDAKLLVIVNDENGINTIGNGIGHDITAVLDGNTSEPFILNDFYVSDINTFKSGYIWFPFIMLSPGEHTLSVKVWDIFNNSSESEIHFVVYPSDNFVISNTYSYPNPFSEFTDIVFEHNQRNVEFTLHAEIYSVTGQLVRAIEQTSMQIGSVSNPLRWDGLNDQGHKVPPGIYICNLIAHTSGGLFTQTSSKMIFQK